MQNLVDRTGVNRGGLYATYGDKRDLFLASLRMYDGRMRAGCWPIWRRVTNRATPFPVCFSPCDGHSTGVALVAPHMPGNAAV